MWTALFGCLLSYGSIAAQVQTYTDETAYLDALNASNFEPLVEDFDGADWDAVHDASADSVVAKGITWTATDQVATGQGPAISGWAVYDNPGGDPDILYGSSVSRLYGLGGWFKTSTPTTSVQIYLDNVAVPDAHIVVGTQHVFLGVIDPDGFTTFEIRDTEGAPGDEKHWFMDNVTFGQLPLYAIPSLSNHHLAALIVLLLLLGSFAVYRRHRKTESTRA